MPPTRRTALKLAALAPIIAMTPPRRNASAAGRPGPVTTGAERLARDAFSLLRGKRVGLITNDTGRVGDDLLVDLMARDPGMTLAAILSPEHGLRGNAEAGAKVTGGRDPYGASCREALRQDLQADA